MAHRNRWFSQLETTIYSGFSMAMLNNQMVIYDQMGKRRTLHASETPVSWNKRGLIVPPNFSQQTGREWKPIVQELFGLQCFAVESFPLGLLMMMFSLLLFLSMSWCIPSHDNRFFEVPAATTTDVPVTNEPSSLALNRVPLTDANVVVKLCCVATQLYVCGNNPLEKFAMSN